MDPNTGHIYEGTEEEIKEVERRLKRELVSIDQKALEDDEVRLMLPNERTAYINKVVQRRAKNKAARKARRKNRR
jgi:hypothetical protein